MAQASPISPEQRRIFAERPAQHPLLLFYQFNLAEENQHPLTGRRQLAEAAAPYGGQLRWAASEEQVLIGPVPLFARACLLHFGSRAKALEFVESTAHAATVAGLRELRVSVVNQQPRAIARLSAALAWLLPRLPLHPRREAGEEPYQGSSLMPTPAAYQALEAHPRQQEPVVMINWLKFRPQADYPAGTPSASGFAAYQRYGKVALWATHSLGAKLLYAGRYQQVLIGNGGDPAVAAWDECALMQYPSRQVFKHMASLAYYRRALAHRQAGLAEHGQGLSIARADADFVWHKAP